MPDELRPVELLLIGMAIVMLAIAIVRALPYF